MSSSMEHQVSAQHSTGQELSGQQQQHEPAISLADDNASLNGSATTTSSRPASISLPPPPPLDPSTTTPAPPTNTLAILLPHPALFDPTALALLRIAFEGYGNIAHWAPVRGFGRVIVVYYDDAAAAMAKKEGDMIKLDVDLDGDDDDAVGGNDTQGADPGYFGQKRKPKSKGIVLRVFSLPPTSLSPTDNYLRPPEAERNFLISPPGSPPEGWEPIVEDGPNASPLADDLRRALEALQLADKGRGGRELILEEGGVRVEVEDTTVDGDKLRFTRWGEEVPEDRPGLWDAPKQTITPVPASLPSLGLGAFTPSGRILPTARPPM